MKNAITSAMVSVLFFSSATALAQEVRIPTAEECANLFPCEKVTAKRTKRVRRSRPEKLSQPNPEILRRLQDLERYSWHQHQPFPQFSSPPPAEPHLEDMPAPVVNNYVTVQASAPANQQEAPEPTVRFGLEIGGLASVHSSWWETSPGFYGAVRIKLKRLALSVESGYQRTTFGDGSTVEDVYVSPTAGYELGRGNLRFTLTAGFGFWTTLEDWITPICGRSTCDGENENALTAYLEPGLTMNVVKNLEFSLGMPVRWVSSTPDGDEWTLGIRAGLGVFLP